MKKIKLLITFVLISQYAFSSLLIKEKFNMIEDEKGVILEWQNVNAAAYDIYFGESSASSRIVFNTTVRRHLFKDLEINKRYYYKIVPKGSNATFDEYSFRYKEEGVKIFDGNAELNYQEEINEFAKKNYTDITGFLRIQQNFRRDIRELGWFQNLNKVGSLSLSYIDGLTSLYGLHNIFSVSGSISITNVSNIKEISFDKLFLISGSLTIAGNSSLESISMNRLYIIFGDLNIGGNISYYLDDEGHGFTSFPTSTSYGNPLVTEITFDNLNSVRGDINFCKNESLSNLNCLSNMTEGAYEDLIIWDNDELVDITGISNLTVVAESLAIVGNDRLENLSGLNNITIIAFDLLVSGNKNLKSLNFDKIEKVGQILIENNMSLDNLTGLKNLDEVAKVISVRNNIKLDNYCGIVNLINNNGIGSYLRVYGNLWNPSTYSSITNSDCESTLSIDNNFITSIKVFPNPTKNFININSEKEIFKIIIYNSSGKELSIYKNQNRINIEHLSKGLYFVKVLTKNNEKEIVKIIKE